MLKMEYEFPEGVSASIEGGKLIVKGKKGQLERPMVFPRINAVMEGSKIVIQSDKDEKRIKAIMGTWQALAGWMSGGVTKGWKCQLRLVYSHFPVKLKMEGNVLVIENFLGERQKRTVVIDKEVKIEINGNDIMLTGIDKEKVGQAGALIEQKVTVKKFDRRIFQDGIYKIGDTELIEE